MLFALLLSLYLLRDALLNPVRYVLKLLSPASQNAYCQGYHIYNYTLATFGSMSYMQGCALCFGTDANFYT